MKRPTMLVQAILQQAAMDLDLSVERDVLTLVRRCKHEGLPFLTITLPTLSDALEQGIEAGRFSCPSAFGRHGSLPRFLGGFFKRVFTLDGGLRPDACSECIHSIRQVCRFFKKLSIPCMNERANAQAIQHFLDVEGELRQMTPLIERKDNVLEQVAGIIWSQVFPEPDYSDFVCHHGPGVTADRYRSNERFRIRKWNTRSESTFPSDLHCYPNYGLAAEASGIVSEYRDTPGGEGFVCDQGIEYLSLRNEEPVKVVFVPKTQTAPRVIAMEPSHMQYMQQSIKDHMYERIESHRLTKHSIRFTDQSVNQRLAHSSSIDKRLATLDLKDASDRVHLHLVQRIFKTSGILEFLEDARSLHATLPNGRNVVLWKYASMGSALCFPVEASVFYTLIQSAMHILDGRRPSSQSIEKYSRLIAVYGDDIIIPVTYTDFVVRYLESYGLKVNINKSFSNSNFRESCGADFYKGKSVLPIYARMIPHDDSRDWGPEEIMSWVTKANQFYMVGQWHVANVIQEMVRRIVRRTIPRAREPGPGLVFLSLLYTTNLRWNADLQCYKQKRTIYQPIKRKDSIDGHELATLNKWGITTYFRGRTPTMGAHPSADRYSGIPADLCKSAGTREESTGALGLLCSGNPRGKFEDPRVNARVDYLIVRGIQDEVCGLEQDPNRIPEICTSDEEANRSLDRRRSEILGDYCLTESRPDPLKHLFEDVIGLDFDTSVKRGCFKSTSRWITLHR